MKYIHSRPVWFGAALFITDLLFFGFTNPKQVASILLIVGFGLVLLNLYYLIYGLQRAAGLYIPWVAKRKSLRISLLSCIGLILALLSIGQLTTRDIVLIPLATLVITAYFSYRQPSAGSAGH